MIRIYPNSELTFRIFFYQNLQSTKEFVLLETKMFHMLHDKIENLNRQFVLVHIQSLWKA